jgi:hypothetical protein
MLFFQHPARATQSVTLSWTPSLNLNVIGYKIYTGTASRQYSITNNIGLLSSTTITGLVRGQTYYFAATTYDLLGRQSALSSEVTYTVPPRQALLGSATKVGKQFSFIVSGLTGSNYVVQASADLLKWVTLQTNQAPFTFVDTNAASFSRRFYRAYYLSL